jgi:RNA-directed DNA polymerase
MERDFWKCFPLQRTISVQPKLVGEFPPLGFKSENSLLRRIGLTEKKLDSLLSRKENFYKPFFQDKKGGGRRLIDNPIGLLKHTQSLIDQHLLKPLVVSEAATCGVKGKTHFDAIRNHISKPYVWKTDLSNCYPSVSTAHLVALFRKMDCSQKVAETLADLLTRRDYLPQGSPASSSVLNLLFFSIDTWMLKKSSEVNCDYTRHGDDICISGTRTEVFKLIRLLLHQLRILKLSISRRKTLGMPSSSRQRVLKVGANTKISIPKDYRRKVRSEVKRIARYGSSTKEINSVFGRLRYVEKTHPQEAKKLFALLSNLSSAKLIEDSGINGSELSNA